MGGLAPGRDHLEFLGKQTSEKQKEYEKKA
jgi:hypothetical protein